MPEKKKYWPYILMMPTNYDERTSFIKDILASRIGPSIMPRFEETGSVLQKELIKELPHSNKSIIRYLEMMRKYNLIETGSKVEKGKRVVFHTLTGRGWGLARFLSRGLPLDLSEITENLLEDYLTSLLSFYRDHNLDETIFFEIVTRVRAKAMLDGSMRYDSPDFTIIGSSALFTMIECDPLNSDIQEISCRIPKRFAGGSTIELAIELARQSSNVVFVSSIGDDLNGWNVISSLIPKGIDVSHFVVETEKKTNETILIEEGSNSRTLVGIDEGFSLSITSPSQVPWDVLERTGLVYIGEVFLEVALAVATACKPKNIPVVFRCSPHFWKLGVSKISPLLSQVDILLISSSEWDIAKKELGLNPIVALRKLTTAEILIKMKPDQFGIMTKNSDMLELLSYPSDSTEFDSENVSNLLQFYKQSRDLENSLHQVFD